MALAPSSSLARRALAGVAALCLAASLGACTASPQAGQKLDGEAGRVQKVVERFGRLATDGDARTICKESLAPELRTRLSRGSSCETAVARAAAAADYPGLPVDAVRMQGDRAVATIVRAQGFRPQTRIALARTAPGAPWQITAFGDEAPAGTSPEGTTPAGASPDTKRTRGASPTPTTP